MLFIVIVTMSPQPQVTIDFQEKLYIFFIFVIHSGPNHRIVGEGERSISNICDTCAAAYVELGIGCRSVDRDLFCCIYLFKNALFKSLQFMIFNFVIFSAVGHQHNQHNLFTTPSPHPASTHRPSSAVLPPTG